jgi:hypothetical protein
MTTAASRAGCLVLMVCAGILGFVGTSALAANNNNCTLPASTGYQNCVGQASPTAGTTTVAWHCGRTWRHQIYNTSSGNIWGPWERSTCGQSNALYILKNSSWTWTNGTTYHQARVMSGATMAVAASID